MTADVQPSAMGPALAPETVLAGRYAIGQHLRTTPLAAVYRAQDLQAEHSVLVHVIDADLSLEPNRHAAIAAVGAAAELDHQAIASPLDIELSHEPPFIVTRDVEGLTLRELLARRAAGGNAGFAARGAIRITLAICEAVTAAWERGVCHGALSTDSICVDDSGQVTLVDFGLGAALARAIHSAAWSGSKPPFVAPEAAASGELDPAVDVYGLGHLLYEILIGQPLRKGGPRPSEANRGVPAEIDEIIARAVRAQPGRQPASAAELADALRQAMSQASAPSAAASVGGPSLAHSLPSGQHPVVDPGILADTEEKWLVSKGRLDYGPFTMAEIVEQIRAGQIVSGNVIVDNHSSERSFVEEHPLLTGLIEQARQLRDDNRRANAEAVHAKKEKRRGAVLYGVIAGGVAVLGLVAFLVVSSAGEDSGADDVQSIEVVGEGGLKVPIRFLKSKTPGKRKKSSRSGRSGRSGGQGDDTLALDLSEGGGSERLDGSVIDGVVQRNGSRLGGCLAKNGGGRAHIEFIVKGATGKVSWVKVNGEQAGGLYKCVSRVMRGMKFPTVDGPRTRAEFEMEL